MVLESTARGKNDWFRDRFVDPADTEHWIAFGKKAGVHLSSVATWPTETLKKFAAADTAENFHTKLVRLGRRKDSLLMRADLAGPHDTTYVFGKTFWKMRVQTLNPQRTWSGWTRLS